MIYDNDAKACAWLEQLPLQLDRIDNRSISEVTADELKEYTQCHFFAGIGGWPYALQLAGWPDDVPVWTGSCPCQPFSAAGKRKGESDERHLWPEFRRLIDECRPPVVFGEQVASKLGRAWLAGVQADLEALGYAFGAADLCAAGIGAPHIRQRLFWLAYRSGEGLSERISNAGVQREAGCAQQGEASELCGDDGGVVNGDSQRCSERTQSNGGAEGSQQQAPLRAGAVRSGNTSGVGDSQCQNGGRGDTGEQGQASSVRRDRPAIDGATGGVRRCEDQRLEYSQGDRWEQGGAESVRRIPAVRRCESGFWAGADYLWCSDEKWRPAQSSPLIMADGTSAELADGTRISKQEMSRVTALRGIGNAIVPQVAAQFVIAFMQSICELDLPQDRK